ncbi:phosphoenolpyruvate carboxylase [Flavobacteriaceae bacterium Ap0902]|nr:phosphoenolpyruvate carboxylase [Flavobacteriaceae bacterium Ap0902]
MKVRQQQEKFRQIVGNKYQIYNALFMSLPYDKMSNIGMLLPFLYEESKEGYENGKTPIEIVNEFFDDHTELQEEERRIDILFRIIQYIERQVVLFDSIEDAAFSSLHDSTDTGTLIQFNQIAEERGQLEKARNKLMEFAVKIVFTAHPTQFYSNNVQRILYELRSAIQRDAISEVDALLQQLGMTPFVADEKPTPYDEALSIIYYLRYVYYDTLGELMMKVKDIYGQAVVEENAHLFQLGFWPGGDRDGNPFVKSETTAKVAEELRVAILKSYYNHIKKLRGKFTFRGVSESLKEISEALYQMIFEKGEGLSLEELINHLEEIREVVVNVYNGLYIDYLDDLIMRIKMFGYHFAALDIRQDSSIHDRIIREIFQHEFDLDYDAISKEEKISLLTEKSLNINPEDYSDPFAQDTIRNVYQLKEIQKRNGELGLNRYIISNSESIWDVLNVYALFKYCGYKEEEIKFDIIPLFETMQGLGNSKHTMDTLYNLPSYKDHLKRRNMEQTIMLGFSDGTKDGGYVKANWGIYQTKETLTDVSKNNDIKVVFFDGRGGPPARGGGKTHQFYASQGNTIANNRIELTIQGQTITSVFGTKEHATYNFEQLLSAGLKNSVFADKKVDLTTQEREVLDQLATWSYQKYNDLKSHPMFVPYLENMSTLKYYGKTNIGSRPSKRGKSDSLVFSDLRAIPFVGSWSQLKQNVPGYYGFGTAIHQFKEEGKVDVIKDLFTNSDFFRTLVQNSMMSMTKTYFPLTYYMQNNPQYSEFWSMLHEEFLLSREMMLEITGYDMLMEDEPLSRLSVEMREKIVLPLLTIQQYALQKLQEGTDKEEIYANMVTRSLFGNINASRNSA